MSTVGRSASSSSPTPWQTTTTPYNWRERGSARSSSLSDRAVAEELSISERTVTTHVGKILKKLGFQSRAQVAARTVQEQQLPPDPG